MPSVLRSASSLSLAAVLVAARVSAAAPAAHLAAMPTSGTAPLVVAFDTARSAAGTIAEHLIFAGNGDAITLGMAEQVTNYNYTLPGFYLASTWLHDDSGIALAPPVPISVTRLGDGQAPPTASVVVQATTDPLTFAFMATVTAQDGDPIAAQLWDFGDGTSDGEAAPFHTYAHAGVYQAALVAATQSGMPLYARTIVIVHDPTGAVPPSLLMTASPEDASLLTPITLTAYLEGVAPDAKVASAEVDWPDLIDASPTLTPTATGITLTSQHALATAGSWQVPVVVTLASQMEPLTATIRVTSANVDGTPPSPALLASPSPGATVGVAYAPGPTSGGLVVGGDGPFAFGAATPSPAGFAVDSDGHITWTPTRAQAGFQRLSVRITDANGQERVVSWVVQVAGGKKSGCALAGGTTPSTVAWPLALLVVALALRRRRLTA